VIKGHTFSFLADIDANSDMIVGVGEEAEDLYSGGSWYYYRYPFIISYGTPSASLNWALRDNNANGKYAFKI
jgi:hypothetical protein